MTNFMVRTHYQILLLKLHQNGGDGEGGERRSTYRGYEMHIDIKVKTSRQTQGRMNVVKQGMKVQTGLNRFRRGSSGGIL
jgi:hypothetical protein